MAKSKLFVAIIWASVIGISVVQGLMLPTSRLARQFAFPWPVLIGMPIAGVIFALFYNSVPGKFLIGERFDRKFGPDSYRRFMNLLKLDLLLACMCFAIGIVGVLKTVQLGGASTAFRVAGFFLSGGVAFSIVYFVRHRRGLYEAVPTKAKVPVGPAMDAAFFWNEAKTRRNLCFASWYGWLLAGPLLFWIYSQILPTSEDRAPGLMAEGTWIVFFLWAHARLRRLRCFRCGEQAFSHPLFFMKDAKCRNCGVTPTDV
jgi:hypothetical protein